MNKIFAAVLLGLLLLISVGCSSTPAGTDNLNDLVKNPAEKLGKNVVVVGLAETKTPLSSLRMFKLYGEGGDFIWVKYPDTVEEPPQGINVRVFGTMQQGEFNLIGKVYYINSNKVAME